MAYSLLVFYPRRRYVYRKRQLIRRGRDELLKQKSALSSYMILIWVLPVLYSLK